MKTFKNILSILCVCFLALGMAACSDEPTDSGADGIVSEKAAFQGKYIVNTDYVKEHFEDENVLFIDARGPEAAKKGTVEGAVAIQWQMLSFMEGKGGDPMWGTVLPAEKLSKALGDLGVSKDKNIILFADANEGWGDEGRVLWTLLEAGYADVKMVDGGFAALKKAGIATAKGGVTLDPVTVEIAELDSSRNISTDDLEENYENIKVVDVRTKDEYEGATKYGEVKGGHLPGAILIEYTDLFNKNGNLKSNAEIKEMFELKGITSEDTVVTYCTAGIRSAYVQLILEMIEYPNAKNYDESYHWWAATNEVE